MSRIVAGRAGGQRLRTPTGESTRPTSDRVREAFFAALAAWNGSADAGPDQQLAGLAFLDLYAGSGAVGLEAASRGAGTVWLVENDQRAASVIRQNMASTALKAAVQQRSATTVAQEPGTEVFDVVWLDPPYLVSTATVQSLVEGLFSNGWVADDGVVVIERSSRSEPVLISGHDQWTKKYGETTLYWVSARPETSIAETPHAETPNTDDSSPDHHGEA